MKTLLVAIVLGLVPSFALAKEVNFRIVDADGAPLANAVVQIESASAGTPVLLDMSDVMAQEDRAFKPHVLIVPVGTEVSFPNRDRFRHHVYSFSKGNRFELQLYGKDESRTIKFDNSGLVAIGCNIHDDMIGYIHVVGAVHAAKSDASGVATINPDGATGPARLWLPDQPGKWLELAPIPTGDTTGLELRVDAQANAADWHTGS